MLSLVIPCYNERANLQAIVARLKAVQRAGMEVILVDNGSTDGSDFDAVLAGQDVIRSVRVEKNRGYGFGIMQGLAAARGDVLSWTHADMQTDVGDVLTCYDLLRVNGGRAVVKGKRRNRKFLEEIFTAGMQWVVWCVLGVRLDDINAQPKMFGREFYEIYLKPGAPDDFSLDLYMLTCAKKAGFTVLTVPVVFGKRAGGEAKGGGSFRTRIKLIKRTFAYIFELRGKV